MRALFVLSSILLLSACAGMLMGGGSGSERPSSAPRNTQTTADDTISGSLRRQYSADQEISQYGIGIRSQGGRVTLTGTVGSYDIRDRIVDAAKNTHGVVAVDSRVVVNTNL
ncbi:MAG: BON domain-containing protein [Woeseia sp.]|jgi:osmotically-inducible protein OsmY|nr:BON domain-containing protein [Woeseia sp.]